MATSSVWKTVVWERQNQMGIWCSYPGEVGQLLEQSSKKELNTVWLGDADISLKSFTVNLNKMIQISEATGTVSQVRRKCVPQDSAMANGIVWQWCGDRHDTWHNYDADVINYIEEAYKEGESVVDLSENFPHCNYEIHLDKMQQRNKRTKHRRPIRRITVTPYPVAKCSLDGVDQENVTYEALSAALDNVDCSVGKGSPSNSSPVKSPGKHLMKHVTDLWNRLKKPADRDSDDSNHNLFTTANKKQCTSSPQNAKLNEHNSSQPSSDTNMEVSTSNSSEVNSNEDAVHGSSSEPVVAIVGGKPWYHLYAPHVPHSKLKPVPGVEPVSVSGKKRIGRKKGQLKTVRNDPESVLDTYTEKVLELPKGEDDDKECVICFEDLGGGSPYDNDSTIIKLQLCHHIFHRSCLKAMYESGSKDGCLQCPTCKTIHGEKHGIQPPGTMVYHVIPYSLPGYPDCKTIRIVYDIPSGIQGPEHPNPGRRYSARGFPRTCYLPNNESGRRVLKLLVKAWERKLIFTVGTSATTGEENTVTWNEIHHKTEFGFNKYGHGYPDDNYIANVIAELAVHGVTDKDVC